MDYKYISENWYRIPSVKLIYSSSLDPSRKVYVLDNIVIKSRKFTEDRTQHLRANNLEQEYNIVRKCSGLAGIEQALYYSSNKQYEILLLTFEPGVQLECLRLNFFHSIVVLWKLSKLLFKLSMRGVSHNDLTHSNILVTEELKVSLIDFDQAIITSKLKAFAGNYVGLKIKKSKVSYSMLTVIKDFLKKRFPTVVYGLKQLIHRNNDYENNKLPELDKNATPELQKMLVAWKIAQKSNASSPGRQLAYYSLDFQGFHFPGERPWLVRWNVLKSISDYSGKTIIELGCNMGLLSTYLMKEAGAKKCIGVDHDVKILESSKMISEVHGVNPEFFKINFNSKNNWEKKLLSYKADIIFALNVLNWLDDKQRFLSFLSNFQEVIFEGHDLPEIEKERFEDLGFCNIEEIGFSERKRIILRCRK